MVRVRADTQCTYLYCGTIRRVIVRGVHYSVIYSALSALESRIRDIRSRRRAHKLQQQSYHNAFDPKVSTCRARFLRNSGAPAIPRRYLHLPTTTKNYSKNNFEGKNANYHKQGCLREYVELDEWGRRGDQDHIFLGKKKLPLERLLKI